jgi:hypothetical protein
MELVKVYCEVKFEPSFLFEDGRTRNEIKKELSKQFPFLDIKDEAITFVNKKTTTNCQVYRDRVVVDIDDPSEINKLKTVVASTIPFIMKRMEVDKSIRIGVRAHYVDPGISTAGRSSRVVADHFFSQHVLDLLKSSTNNSEANFEPRVSFKMDVSHEMSMIVNVAYLQSVKGEISRGGEFSFSEVEKVQPLTDLDIFTMVPKDPDQLNGVIGAMCSTIDSYPNKIWRR